MAFCGRIAVVNYLKTPSITQKTTSKIVAVTKKFHSLKILGVDTKRVTGRKDKVFSLFRLIDPPRCLQLLAGFACFFERNMQQTHGARAKVSYGIEGTHFEVEGLL